jgi:hypothetical protein
MVGLWTRFFVAVYELTKTQRAYRTERARIMKREHDERIAERAARSHMDVGRLRELQALQSPPAGSTFRGVLASVMLDRLLLYVAIGLAFAVIALLVRLGPLAGHGLLAAGVVCVFLIALHFYLAAGRGNVDPTAQQTVRAAHIAKLFAAPYVVMGHTHKPLSVRTGDSTYINVGSWAEEDDPTSTYRAARTHVVIHERDGKVEAHFYEWISGDGPRLRA